MSDPTPTAANPPLTVLIPAYGDAAQLRDLLADLQAQDAPADLFEILVVDDGSPRPIEAQIVDRLRGHRPVRVVRTPNAGGPGARNNGSRLTSSPQLLFLDQDMRVPGDYVRTMHQTQAEVGPAALSADFEYELAADDTPFSRWYFSKSETWGRQTRQAGSEVTPGVFETHPILLSSTNLSIPRALFEEIGGFPIFPVAGTEDQALGLKLAQSGARVLRTNRTTARHVEGRVTFERFCERQRSGMAGTIDLLVRFPQIFGTLEATETHQVNGPLRRSDPLGLSVRKLMKSAIGTPPLRRAGFKVVDWLERHRPQSALLRRAYDALLGAHLQRGWREGLRRQRK